MADVLDVLIVGGGAAGYTAGIFAARDRRRALLLEKFSSGGRVLNCEARGQIVTDLRMRTRVPGILDAGDVRAEAARQLVTSAGDGATAALAAVEYLRHGR